MNDFDKLYNKLMGKLIAESNDDDDLALKEKLKPIAEKLFKEHQYNIDFDEFFDQLGNYSNPDEDEGYDDHLEYVRSLDGEALEKVLAKDIENMKDTDARIKANPKEYGL